MGTYIKKTVLEGNIVEAITFDELVEFGKKQPEVNIVDGIPWHFQWEGLSVTHENNDAYIVNTVMFKRGEILTISEEDELVTYPEQIFLDTHKRI